MQYVLALLGAEKLADPPANYKLLSVLVIHGAKDDLKSIIRGAATVLYHSTPNLLHPLGEITSYIASISTNPDPLFLWIRI